MALKAKVLQKKAEKFELKKLQALEVTKELALALEPVLQDVFSSRRPKPTEYDVRRDLVRVFNDIAKEIYCHSKDVPVVVEFGSFVMDLFSTTSDLDLSVNFRTTNVPFPREKQIQTLRKFAKKLYAIQSKGHVYGVLPVTTAKVPILKCVDRGTGVECDISVENRDGILKSQIIHIISSIDERFQKLSFLMKTWAKAYNINSSKDKTLNSLSIILLVAFHLQTRDPPILPPFSSIFKDGTDRETVIKSMSNFVNYGNRNKESLAELFVTLLIKLSSVEKLWPKGLCASTCKASWTSKTWDSKVACISVEDFTDPSQNVARAVGQSEVKQIHKCIDISLKHIFSFMNGKIGAEVRDLLFGQDGIPPPTSLTRRRGYKNPGLPCSIIIPHQANHSRRVATGKRKKNQYMHPDSALTNNTFPQEEQATVKSSSAKKKKRTAEGWMPSVEPANVEGRRISTQHGTVPSELMRSQMRGWEGTPRLQPSSGGWGEGASRLQPSTGGWGEGASRLQPSAGGWGEGAPRLQPSARGWDEGAYQLQPSAGGWGEGAPRLQPSARGWDEGTPRLRPSAGGWDKRTPQQLGARGWGETQRHIVSRDWGGNSW